jgi:hypothetical protein
MIEAVRRLVAQVITPATINTQLGTLNTEYGTTIQQLGPSGVRDAWNMPLSELPRPSIGYDVGWNGTGVAQLIRNGKNRTVVPVWLYVISPNASTQESALQGVGIMFEALMYVMDQFPPNGMEQQTLTGVSPVRVLSLVGDPTIEMFTVDAKNRGAVVGIASKWDLTVDTARS